MKTSFKARLITEFGSWVNDQKKFTPLERLWIITNFYKAMLRADKKRGKIKKELKKNIKVKTIRKLK